MQTHTTTEGRDPSWWTKEHTSGWNKARDAFMRDWEQTKSDLSGGRAGRDLNQDASDTAKQAVGKEAIPPRNVPNPQFSKYEPALRFGYGARSQYSRWDDDTERQLSRDWSSTGHPSKWEEVKAYVKHAWDKATNSSS